MGRGKYFIALCNGFAPYKMDSASFLQQIGICDFIKCKHRRFKENNRTCCDKSQNYTSVPCEKFCSNKLTGKIPEKKIRNFQTCHENCKIFSDYSLETEQVKSPSCLILKNSELYVWKIQIN